MSRRDRNRTYSGGYGNRNDYGPREHQDEQARTRDWEDRYRTQGGDYGRDQERERFGSRERDERDYGARYLGYEARYEPRNTQRFPASFGSHDDQRRVQRFEDSSDYGRSDYGRDDWSQSRYGSGRNLDQGWASESYPYGSRFGRESTQGRYGQPEWGQREGYRGYGREPSHEDWGQQLRDAGREVVRKVKRAFRGPKGYKRSDDRIREDVNDRLSEQDSFDPSEIEVAVANAEVTLTGSVRSRHEKFLAEEIADDVNGVNEVHNQLRVRRESNVNLTGTESTQPATGATTTGWNQPARNTRNNA